MPTSHLLQPKATATLCHQAFSESEAALKFCIFLCSLFKGTLVTPSIALVTASHNGLSISKVSISFITSIFQSVVLSAPLIFLTLIPIGGDICNNSGQAGVLNHESLFKFSTNFITVFFTVATIAPYTPVPFNIESIVPFIILSLFLSKNSSSCSSSSNIIANKAVCSP